MSRARKLQRNFRLLFWGKAFNEFKTLNAIIVLFYLHRGVTLEEVFYLSIVWSFATLIFEVPSGYLADRFGRKRTLMLGTVLAALSWVATWFAVGFPAFIFVFILMAFSTSCFSGTEEAMVYDTLKELKKEKDMTMRNGRQHAAKHMFKIFMPAIGALIAKDLLESQFRLIIGMEFVALTLALIVLSQLIEPKHVKSVTKREVGIFQQSIQTVRSEPFLFRSALNKVLFFIVNFMVWRIYQPFLTDAGLAVVWLGVFYILLQSIIFTSHWFIGYTEKKLGATNIIFWSGVIIIASMIGALFFEAVWLLFICMLAVLVFDTIRAPVFAHFMNSKIKSKSRATTLSNLNVLGSVTYIPIMFVGGWLASLNTDYVFMFGIAICVLVLVFLPIRKRDVEKMLAPEKFTVPEDSLEL